MGAEVMGTCADWEIRRVVVAAEDIEMATVAREWASSVVAADGHVHTVRSDAVDPLIAAIEESKADLAVLGVPTGTHVSRRSAAHWVRTMVSRIDRPMAIIGPQVTVPVRSPGTVVAGVGAGLATDASVPWAACYAEHNDLDLALVGSVPNRPIPGPDGLLDVVAYYIDRGLLAEWKADDLERWTDRIRAATSSTIDISQLVIEGAPGPGLVNAAVDAAAVVIGRHGFRRDHRALPRPLRYVLDHAAWPVIVVPPNVEA